MPKYFANLADGRTVPAFDDQRSDHVIDVLLTIGELTGHGQIPLAVGLGADKTVKGGDQFPRDVPFDEKIDAETDPPTGGLKRIARVTTFVGF